MFKMNANLIITEAIINDSDLCLSKNIQLIHEKTFNEFEDQIENEENNQIIVSLDEKTIEERQQMLALGLPQEFTSRQLNRRSKKKNRSKSRNKSKSNSNHVIEEDLVEVFEEYWLEFGYDIAYSSWYEKYSEYLNIPYDTSSLDKSQQLDNNLSSNEVIDENESKLLWEDLWYKHYEEEYEIHFNKFLNNSQQNVCSDELKFLSEMLTNIEMNDSHDSNEQTQGQEEEQTNTQLNEGIAQEVNDSMSTSSGLSTVSLMNSMNANNGSDDEEPPDERPTVIKRQHEYDSMDSIELNAEKKVDKNEEKSKSLAPNKKRKSKYWHQRYRLFSRFDEGIKLDNESWYSVTPERIAEHIAKRFTNYHIIIDAFCGSGGNTIQFALISNSVRVIAIDIDSRKIEFAKHNAQIYGVSDRIEFIIGDYMSLAKCCAFKADAVFLSPPWGGPQYLRQNKYKMDMMSPNGVDIFKVTHNNISPNIGFLLPRNIDKNELTEIAGKGNSVEVEQNLLNNKVKTVTAYFGNLIKSSTESKE